jgi:hypothetical protein
MAGLPRPSRLPRSEIVDGRHEAGHDEPPPTAGAAFIRKTPKRASRPPTFFARPETALSGRKSAFLEVFLKIFEAESKA